MGLQNQRQKWGGAIGPTPQMGFGVVGGKVWLFCAIFVDGFA